MRTITSVVFLLSLLCTVPTAQTGPNRKGASKVATTKSWPHPIPLRIRDSSNRNLFVMTLGDVDTALKDGFTIPAVIRLHYGNGDNEWFANGRRYRSGLGEWFHDFVAGNDEKLLFE